MSIQLTLTDDMAIVLIGMLVEAGGKETELNNMRQSLDIVGSEIEEMREKLETSEETVGSLNQENKDCRQLIQQLRPDCYTGESLPVMLRKILGSDKMQIIPSLPSCTWPTIIQIYQAMCLVDDPYLFVEYKTEKGDQGAITGLRSRIADGRLCLCNGSAVLLTDILRLEIIEEDKEKGEEVEQDKSQD